MAVYSKTVSCNIRGVSYTIQAYKYYSNDYKRGLRNIRGDFVVKNKPLFLEKEALLISFEGRTIRMTKPIYRNINRYFLPLNEFIRSIKGRVKMNGHELYFFFDNKTPMSIKSENSDYKFTVINGLVYIALFDICRILNLKSRWNYSNKSISLFWDREAHKIKDSVGEGRLALIRLEDISAGVTNS